jgi:hypothetical protein
MTSNVIFLQHSHTLYLPCAVLAVHRLASARQGLYLFSLLLDLLAGYGYRLGRSLIAYLVVIFGFKKSPSGAFITCITASFTY